MAFCRKCGAELENSALFCVKCGQSVNGVVAPPQPVPVYPTPRKVSPNKMSGTSRLLCLLAAVPALAAALLIFIAKIVKERYVGYYGTRNYYERIYGGPGTVALIIGAALFAVFMFAVLIYGAIGKKNNVAQWILLAPAVAALAMTMIGFLIVNTTYHSYYSSYDSYYSYSYSYTVTWAGWLAFALGIAAVGLYVVSLLIGGSASKAAAKPTAVPAGAQPAAVPAAAAIPVALAKPTPATPDETPAPESAPDSQEEIERLREELRAMQQKINDMEKDTTTEE